MRIIEATLRVKPEKAAFYEKTFKEYLEKVRANEPGTILLEVCRDPAVPNGYRVFEVYKDLEAVEIHATAAYYKEAAAVFIECLEGDHMQEIRRRGLTGRDIYPLVKTLKLERFDTI
jgi:quinol monooxygenase YgiN